MWAENFFRTHTLLFMARKWQKTAIFSCNFDLFLTFFIDCDHIYVPKQRWNFCDLSPPCGVHRVDCCVHASTVALWGLLWFWISFNIIWEGGCLSNLCDLSPPSGASGPCTLYAQTARCMHKLHRVHVRMMFWPEVKNDNLIGEPVNYYLADFYRTRVRSLAMLVKNSLTERLTDFVTFSRLHGRKWCQHH